MDLPQPVDIQNKQPQSVPVNRLLLLIHVRLQQKFLPHLSVSVATGDLYGNHRRDLPAQHGLLDIGERVVNVVPAVVGSRGWLAKETEDKVAIPLHGGVDQQQHGSRVGPLLLRRLPQGLLYLVRPLHDEFPHVVVVVVGDGSHEGGVEAVGLKLVRVESQQLCETVPIGFNLLDYLCVMERGAEKGITT